MYKTIFIQTFIAIFYCFLIKTRNNYGTIIRILKVN